MTWQEIQARREAFHLKWTFRDTGYAKKVTCELCLAGTTPTVRATLFL